MLKSFLLFRNRSFIYSRSGCVAYSKVGGTCSSVQQDVGWKKMCFDNHSATGLEDATFQQLCRTAFVLKLCSSDIITKNAITLMQGARKVLGSRLYRVFMNMTFYGQFCAGNQQREIDKTTTAMLRKNIRPMILVTIEDESRESSSCKEDVKKWFETNKNLIVERIETCNRTQADITPKFVHFRLSALIPSSVLTKVTTKLLKLRRNQPSISNSMADLEHFNEMINNIMSSGVDNAFSEAELQHLIGGISHLNEVCSKAQENDVFLLIDAEYLSFNPAMRAIAHYMMDRFNVDKPILQNTFQAYFKHTPQEVTESLELREKRGIYFGAKIVRGAYMVSERKLAAAQNREDPIWENKMKTNSSYNSIVSGVINKIGDGKKSSRIQLMVACHNEESINVTMNLMEQHGIQRNNGAVIFAQTYGLSDYITNWLGKNDFIVFKSTPIGSVEDTLPYLHRRAQENKAALDFRMDKTLVYRELRNRLALQRKASNRNEPVTEEKVSKNTVFKRAS